MADQLELKAGLVCLKVVTVSWTSFTRLHSLYFVEFDFGRVILIFLEDRGPAIDLRIILGVQTNVRKLTGILVVQNIFLPFFGFTHVL